MQLARRMSAAAAEQGPIDDTTIEYFFGRLREGDLGALGVIYDRYCRLAYAIAYRVLKNPEEAEEVVQEVFLAVYGNSATKLAGKGSVKAWIIGIAYNRSVTRWRKLSSQRYYSSESFEESYVSKTAALPSYDNFLLLRRQLNEAIAALPARQRQTLTMYFWEGYQLSEIAEHLQESLSNTRHHFYRGIATLRREILPTRDSRA
jgi:RNA polymerase sigma-70 factor (ECF subfamily)